jgi:hypothetical protein
MHPTLEIKAIQAKTGCAVLRTLAEDVAAGKLTIPD